MFAYGASQEIQNDTANSANMISYWHQANSFARSRFTYYQSYTGPYGRITSIFRRTYEKFTITDKNVNYKKSFNTLSLNLKYKLNLFSRELIIANYNNYNSVQDKLSLAPKFNNNAFIRTFYEELLFLYGIHPKVTLLATVVFERVLGNNRIDLADGNGNEIRDAKGNAEFNTAGKTVNQTDHGYGVGIDYNFAPKAGLYIRNRWFDHKDTNFTKDTFRGMESSVELKIFF